MKKLDKRSVWLFFFNSFFISIPIFVVAFFYSSIIIPEVNNVHDLQIGKLPIFIIFIIYWIISFIWAKLHYHFYEYGLIEDGFRKSYGIISRRYVTIPYDRIQNVDIHRSLIARLLGVSDLSIQTAGMSGVSSAEGRVPGISKEDAEVIRDELIKRAKNTKQGL